MSEIYIGLMSGTSMDAVDAVVVDLSTHTPTLLASHSHTLPGSYRQALLRLIANQSPHPLQCYGELDNPFGQLFAEAAQEVMAKAKLGAAEIRAIGSHGQTVYHQPTGDIRYTLQIGDPNIISQVTGIATVADFRRRDMAAGGQGAPLVPAFHQAIFQSDTTHRVILNLGGMANITVLSANPKTPVLGFDTGPANVLLDTWSELSTGRRFDENGTFAAQGRVLEDTLSTWLDDPYFHQTPPKSTGREYFNTEWINKQVKATEAPADIQATLTALTACSVAKDIQHYAQDTTEVIVCGGGVFNPVLFRALQAAMPTRTVISSADLGVNPHWVEAIAFAWLAQRTLGNQPGNLPSVTGASREVILGGIYPA